MAASASKKQRPNLNPRMLRWAREWRGRTLEEAARRVQKTPQDIALWEAQPGGPTVRQARELADLYERPFLEFFRSDPPDIGKPSLVPDFRMHRGAEPDARGIRELQAIQAWAEEMRFNALDLFEVIDEPPPVVPETLFVHSTSDYDAAAEHIRRVLNFDIAEQFALKARDRDQLPNIIRKKLDRIGVLTLRRSELWEYDARGICIVASPLPVIVYGSEAPGAQAFTLSHEIGHLTRRQSGISGPRRRDMPFDIERWCDRFSAAFLMPRDAMRAVLGDPATPVSPNIADDRLSYLAGRFRVSQHAMLIRLVHLGYVDEAFYWGVKKPLFDEQEATFKSFARPKYWASRYKSSVGDLYTGLVLEAWNSGRITNHNAAEYMGIKSFEHLFAIRDNFGAS
jgi:Zn-dependent peptidase ImmA (M78 family)